MTDRWMIVGPDPAPTADDLPIVWQVPGWSTSFSVTSVPDLATGDRWCRVTLPPEPEPEDDGVEVDGKRWRMDDANIYEWCGDEWRFTFNRTYLERRAKVAVALGLVDPPVDERVQAVIDAARWAFQPCPEGCGCVAPDDPDRNDCGCNGPCCMDQWPIVVSADDARDDAIFVAAVDALDAAPTPTPCGRSTSADVGERTTVSEQVPAATTDRPWDAHRMVHAWGEWWLVCTEEEWQDDWWTAKCHDEADARRVADALNGQASWPPMRPMSELPDGHDERVLIAYADGRFADVRRTYRNGERSDTKWKRIGWWPLPPHPNGGE